VKVRKLPVKSSGIICYAAEKPSDFHVPPPESYLNRLKSENANPARFIISYNNVPNGAKPAVVMATEIWSSLISSTVPIHLEIRFSTTMQTGALAGTLPGTIYKIYNHGYLPPLAYPVALAEKFTGRELNGADEPDIIITYNSNYSWYYGTDGNPDYYQQDFLTITLHEMAHGLGFTGLFYVDNENKGNYIWPGNHMVYDYYLRNPDGKSLIDTDLFPVPSTALATALTKPKVYFESPILIDVKNKPAELYIPSRWDQGSSLYHLSELYNGTNDGLMTYAQAPGESLHDPGTIAKNMLYDMGWIYTSIEHDSLRDREDIEEPFHVSAKIISDTRLSFVVFPHLHYSFDNFITEDSIQMKATGVLNEYAADLQIEKIGTRVYYYISAADRYERIYTYPAGAGETVFTFYAGEDTIPPDVDYLPVEFMLITEDTIDIEASIWDNLGIDTVIIDYLINDIQQESFGLANDSANIYKGFFDFSTKGLVIGDTISYKLTVIDNALGKNTVVDPPLGYHQFAVEEIPEFQEAYSNDFERSVKDFLRNGFDRYKPEGWNNYALHTDHPYKSPSKDNTNWEFLAQLRIPIKLRPGDAFMYFDEIALIEPGDPGPAGQNYGDSLFYDYVVVEGSRDGGENWVAFEDGWDCRRTDAWEELFNSIIDERNNISLALPTEVHYRPHLINLLGNGYFTGNDEVLIRFRLFSDPYFNGWGWAIDNLLIQGELSGIPDYPLVPETIRIYPNPSTGNVRITMLMKEDAGQLTIGLYDLAGKELLKTVYYNQNSSFDLSLDLSHLGNGIYFFRIGSGNQTITRKVVIAR
jgi:hypothetical protein